MPPQPREKLCRIWSDRQETYLIYRVLYQFEETAGNVLVTIESIDPLR